MKKIEISISENNNISIEATNIAIGSREIIYYLELAKLKVLYTNGHLFDILNK
jgi:hypothetical protein